MSPVRIITADSEAYLSGILKLQAENHKYSVPADIKAKEGFVTVKHTLDQIKSLLAHAPQIIAVNEDDRVVGYALVMVKALKDEIPILRPLFEQIDQLSYQDKLLKEEKWYVMGQVCIAKDYRRQGVFRKLYEAHRKLLKDQFDFCITDISASNTRSIESHLAVGFEVIHRFVDEVDEWIVVLLRL